MNRQMVWDILESEMDVKPLWADMENWSRCLGSIPHRQFVPLSYKPSFIAYQKAYFSDVYEEYEDLSVVLYRGGLPVGIWPLCFFKTDGRYRFGSLGGFIAEPLFTGLPKAEAQRSMIQKIFRFFVKVGEAEDVFDRRLDSQITVMEDGSGQWQRKWMEAGARCVRTSWWAYADLDLSWEEIQSRIRRTNKYSVAKGGEEYIVQIYDSDDGSLSDVFAEFHNMHREISQRETRSQSTWDLQEKSVRENSEKTGYDFVVFIRDRETFALAGSALFAATPQSGLYCVAAYDRKRFAKPVGHIVQAAAMEYMKKKGVRWYEIGERTYPNDEGSNEKLVNIGRYKEGFATHIFPKIVMEMDMDEVRNFL